MMTVATLGDHLLRRYPDVAHYKNKKKGHLKKKAKKAKGPY